MPYIPKSERNRLDGRSQAKTSGELNFEITMLVMSYITKNQGGLSYANINTVVGVLECVKLELYRRVAASYEDEKKKENGEVYK